MEISSGSPSPVPSIPSASWEEIRKYGVKSQTSNFRAQILAEIDAIDEELAVWKSPCAASTIGWNGRG